MDRKYKYLDTCLIAGVIISYCCFFVSTMLKAEFFIELFSPITGFAIGITIIGCLGRMDRYWKPSFILALGVFSYMLADILVFLSNWVVRDERLYTAAAFVFLLPNYFFGGSVALYFIQKLKGKQLYQFLINTMTFTVIGIVVLRRILVFMSAFYQLDGGRSSGSTCISPSTSLSLS